jgi:serine/threonine protein kinase
MQCILTDKVQGSLEPAVEPGNDPYQPSASDSFKINDLPLQACHSEMVPENAYEREKSPDPENPIIYPWPIQADKDYECIASCGSGSFAQVYKARVRSSGEVVAVKVMAGDKWALQEAAILRGLDHENICRMIDCFPCEEEGVTCLVMQFASGGDLLERMISAGPLTEKAAADLARQVERIIIIIMIL